MAKFIVDANAWIDYFQGDAQLKKWIEENTLETPASVVAEVATVLRRQGKPIEKIRTALQIIFQRSIVRPLEFADAERVSELVINGKLHFSDALAYVGASQDAPFLTDDSDFKGKPFIQWTR